MAALLDPLTPPNGPKPRREFAPRALVALFAFHGALQVLVIGTGLLHIPLSSALAWCIGLAALGAAATAFRLAPAPHAEPFPWPPRILTALGVLVLCVYFTVAWVKIDPSFDGNWYHIPNIHFWAAKGYVHWVTAEPPAAWCTLALDYMNGYPNAHEVTSFWLARLAGDEAVNAASALYLPLGALGVYIVSQRLGAGASWSAFGALLYLLLTVNIAQIHTTYVDSSFAACVVGLLALMALIQARKSNVPPVLAVAIGAAIGLITGIKGNGPLVALLAGLFIAGTLLLNLWGGKTAERRARLRAGAIGLALIIVAALATGGYWNLRNWAIGGSPLYPIGITLGGVELFPGEPFEKIVNTRGQTPPEMREWPAWKQVGHTWLQGQSMKRWHGALGEYASRFGGLSFLWLLGALPASIFLALVATWRLSKRDTGPVRRTQSVRYLYLFAFIALLFLTTPNNWWARYTVWIFAIGLPAFIYCASRPMKRPWRATLKWCWVLACCALFLYEAGTAFNNVAHATPPFWTPGPNTTYRKPAETSLYTRMLAEPEVPVALYKLITRRQSILGTLCQPIGLRPVYFLSEATAADPQVLAQFVKERGIRYVITGEKGAQPKGIQQFAPEKQYVKAWNINIYAVE